MSANRKDIVQHINEAFAENNLEKVLSFCSDDLTWTMVGDTTVRGKAAIRQWMASMNPEPPQLAIQQMIAEGDTVVTRGDMLMPDKNGGPFIPYTFCDIYRFAGDNIAELISFIIPTDRVQGASGTLDEHNRQMAQAQQG